jgi:hypothetical protein
MVNTIYYLSLTADTFILQAQETNISASCRLVNKLVTPLKLGNMETKIMIKTDYIWDEDNLKHQQE